MKHLKINKCAATLFSGILSLLLIATTSSCQKDTFSEGNSSATTELSSLSMNVDLGNIELDPEAAIQYAEGATPRGIEMTTPGTDTDASGKKLHPTFSFAQTGKDEEDFPVFIALFGERQQTNCYALATWKLIKEARSTGGDRYFVRAKGEISFIEGFAPDISKIKEGENWRLHAIYAPNGAWDATNQSYKWSAKKVVKKLYGPNEKLAIGTDIDIPFVLGCRTPNASGSSWYDGYPMTAEKKFDKVTKKDYWSFGMKQLYENPEGKTLAEKGKAFNPRFKMLGSLMAIQLQNTMKDQDPEDFNKLDLNETLIQGLEYRPVYDFLIRGFYIESTQAVTSVAYSFKDLPMNITPEQRQNLLSVGTKGIALDAVRWIGRPGIFVSETPQSTPTQANPTRIYIPFWESEEKKKEEERKREIEKNPNYAPLNRESTSKTLYFWITDVDKDRTDKPNHEYGTAIWADLYNKTLKVVAGPTFVYTAQSNHKTGTAYRSTVSLKEELRVNPLARMGIDYITGNPNQEENCLFARKEAHNGNLGEDSAKPQDPGAGKPYQWNAGDVTLKSFQFKKFKVSYTVDNSPQKDGTDVRYLPGEIIWEVPDRFDVYSVFPYVTQKAAPGFGRLLYKEGTDEEVHAGTIHRENNEYARIDGILYQNLKSIYYRKDNATYRKQTYAGSRNTVYAFRFIGTPMAVAVRYTEIGKWYNPNLGTNYGVPIDDPRDVTPTSINRHSRFRIEMKTIGNAYGFKSMTDNQAEKYLKEIITLDSFWQKGDDARSEILQRDLHLNGAWSHNGNKKVTYGGQGFFFWTRERTDQRPSGNIPGALKTNGPGVYEDHRMDNGSLHYHHASPIEIGIGQTRGYCVLPWMSVHQQIKKDNNAPFKAQ